MSNGSATQPFTPGRRADYDELAAMIPPIEDGYFVPPESTTVLLPPSIFYPSLLHPSALSVLGLSHHARIVVQLPPGSRDDLCFVEGAYRRPQVDPVLYESEDSATNWSMYFLQASIGLELDFIYDDQEMVVLRNKSDYPLRLEPAYNNSEGPVSVSSRSAQSFSPGNWHINYRQNIVLLLHCRRRNFATSMALPGTSTERQILRSDGNLKDGKKRKVSQEAEPAESFEHRFLFQEGFPGQIEWAAPHDESDQQLASLTAMYDLEKVPLEHRITMSHRDLTTRQDVTEYSLTIHKRLQTTRAGSVFVATMQSTISSGTESQQIVVKVLQDKRSGERTARDILSRTSLFETELENHRDLNHPCLVRLVGVDARYRALMMQHIPGHDLAHHENHPASLQPKDLLRIISDVTAALAYMHNKRRLLHKDIKPQNIMYSREHGACVIDFGLATKVGVSSRGGGTPWYIAPETISDWQNRGEKADVWALGITLFYLLGTIPLPSTFGLTRRDWVIADLCGHKHADIVKQVRPWMNFIRDKVAQVKTDAIVEAKKCPLRSQLLTWAALMLEPNPTLRPSAKEFEKEVASYKDMVKC